MKEEIYDNMIIDEDELKILCNWKMKNDPCSLNKHEEKTVVDLLDRISKEYGYIDWIDAYHQL